MLSPTRVVAHEPHMLRKRPETKEGTYHCRVLQSKYSVTSSYLFDLICSMIFPELLKCHSLHGTSCFLLFTLIHIISRTCTARAMPRICLACLAHLMNLSQPYAKKVSDSQERLWSMLHVLSWRHWDMT